MAATARPVDLSNVKEGGVFRPRRKPEGDYVAKIVKADDHQPNDKTKPLGWVLTIQVEGDARSTYPYYLSPEEKQAWKVRGICVAAGLNVKSARIRFDPNKLVGKTIGIALEDDEYEGRMKSAIADVFTKDEVGPNANEGAPDDEEYDDADEVPDDEVEVPDDEEEEEEEAPAPPPARKRRAKPAPEPEPEEEDEEEEEEAPAPPPRRRRKPAPAPDPEPEDDEEEDEPAPAPRRRASPPPAKKAAPARKRAAAPPVEEDDDDLDDLDTDDLD
jgi:hypothetical protein